MTAVTRTYPQTVPTNSCEIEIDNEKVIEMEAADANIKAGFLVGVGGSANTVISSSSNGGGQGQAVIGYALDNKLWDETNEKRYAWDAAYPTGSTVRIAPIGSGMKVAATADSNGVTQGLTVICTDQATVGYVKDGTTSGIIAGRALATATSAVRFAVQI